MTIYKFILKVFLLAILPAILFLSAYEVLYRNIPNSYKLKHDYLAKSADSVKILILGSSHIFYGVNPEYLPKGSFSAANVSQSLYYDGLIYDRYFKGKVNPEYIIIGMSYNSLWHDLAKSIEDWRIRKYNIYYGFGGIRDYLSDDNYEFTLGDRTVWDYYRSNKDFLKCTDLGFGTSYIDNSSYDLNETGLSAAKRHACNMKERAGDFAINIAALDDILSDAAGRSKIVFLTAPGYSSYRNAIPKEQILRTEDVVEEYIKKYPDVVYLNLFEDGRFVEKDFFDGDHLCTSGAKKLSIILNDTLPKLFK